MTETRVINKTNVKVNAARFAWFRYRARRGQAIQRRYRRIYTPLTRWGLRYLKGPAQLLKNRLNYFSIKHNREGNMTKILGLRSLAKQLTERPFCFVYLILSKEGYGEFKRDIRLSERARIEGRFSYVGKRVSEMLFGRVSVLRGFGLGVSLTTHADNLDEALRVWLELHSKNVWCTAVGCWGRFVAPNYFFTNILNLVTTFKNIFITYLQCAVFVISFFNVLFKTLNQFFYRFLYKFDLNIVRLI